MVYEAERITPQWSLCCVKQKGYCNVSESPLRSVKDELCKIKTPKRTFESSSSHFVTIDIYFKSFGKLSFLDRYFMNFEWLLTLAINNICGDLSKSNEHK